MDDNVPQEEKERRRAEIMEIQDGIAREILAQQVGEECEVIVERRDPLTEMYIGRTWMQAPDNVDGVIRFHALQQHSAGDFVNVRVTKVSGQNLIGEEI